MCMSNSLETVDLTGVPETMLWTLYNRAEESLNPKSQFKDKEAERIYKSIDYDFKKYFGAPDWTHGLRSSIFDGLLRDYLKSNKDVTIIELGCGLETQYQRINNSSLNWYCLDLPEAIAIRKRFIHESERCKYIETSATNFSWMDQVPHSGPVFISVQGLLMYLNEVEVIKLLEHIDDKFDNYQLVFDAIPKWFSKKTLDGFYKTKNYKVPAMPWGIDRNELEDFISMTIKKLKVIKIIPFFPENGVSGLLFRIFSKVPVLRNKFVSIAVVTVNPNLK